MEGAGAQQVICSARGLGVEGLGFRGLRSHHRACQNPAIQFALRDPDKLCMRPRVDMGSCKGLRRV